MVNRFDPQTGMCHLMLFHQPVLDSLLQLAERTVRLPFWRAFLRCVSAMDDGGHMGASEYELYLNFALRWHPERVCLQRISWRNAPSTAVDPQADAQQGHVFVAYHTQYDDLGRRRTDAQGTPDEECVPRSLSLALPASSSPATGAEVSCSCKEPMCRSPGSGKSEKAGWMAYVGIYVQHRLTETWMSTEMRAERDAVVTCNRPGRGKELRQPRAALCVNSHLDDGRRVVRFVAGGARKGSPRRRGALHGSDDTTGLSQPLEGHAWGCLGLDV